MPLSPLSMAARFVLAGAFLLAASSKLRDLASFREGISAYRLLPPGLVPVVGLALPVFELGIAITLLLNIAPPWPALSAAGLLAVFALGIGIAAYRGQDIPCHCFGPSERHRVGVGALLRNVVLLCLALMAAGAVGTESRIGLPPDLGSTDDLLALLSLTGAFTLAVILVEPLALLAVEVPAAWRRRPMLAAAEAARKKTCKTVSLAERDLQP